MAPHASVLLPTHNRADVLPFAVASVLRQTFRDFELLIVADGCSDGTREAAAAFSDPRVRFFDLPKEFGRGYENRNLALREARGEVVACMAHDDLWLDDHLALLLPLFDRPGIEWVHGRALWVEPDGRVLPNLLDLGRPEGLEAYLGGSPVNIPSACVLHRRACLEKYGGWDLTLATGADRELWTRILRGGGGKNLATLDTPTALHFRAAWRPRVEPENVQLGAWLDLSALLPADSWPRFPPVPGRPEQETFHRLLETDPGGFARDLRAAVRELLARPLGEPLAERFALGVRAGAAEEEGRRLRRERDGLAAELADLRSSRAVRLAARLRELLGRRAAKRASAGKGSRDPPE